MDLGFPPTLFIPFAVASSEQDGTHCSNERAFLLSVRWQSSVKAGDRSLADGVRLVQGLPGLREWGVEKRGEQSTHDEGGRGGD